LRGRGTVRIVWQADEAGRFTAVSPALAGIVGPRAADVVGRSWDEVAGSVAEDPDGAVADRLARRQTWSGLTVYWSVDGAPWRIPVVWAGLPVPASDRTPAGFRGFGLLRADAAEAREAREPPPVVAAVPREGDGPAAAGLPDLPQAAEARAGEGTDEVPRPLPADPVHAPPAVAHGGAEAAIPIDALPEPVAPLRAAHGAPAGHRTSARAARPVESLSRLSDSERNALREIARALGARSPFELGEPGGPDADPGQAPAPAHPSFAAEETRAGDADAGLDAVAEIGSGFDPSALRSAGVWDAVPLAPPDREDGPLPPLHRGRDEEAEAPAPTAPDAEPGDTGGSRDAPPPADAGVAVEVVPAPPPALPEPAASPAVADASPGLAQPADGAIADAPSGPAEPDAGDEAAAPTPGPVPAGPAFPRPDFRAAPLHVLAVPARPAAGDRILDRLPLAALAHRDERVLFANRAFLDLVGCVSLAAFEEAGGLAGLFGGSPPLRGAEAGAAPMALATPRGPLTADVSVARVEWGEAPATLILVAPERAAGAHERLAVAESARSAAERSLAEIGAALADAELRLGQAERARIEAESARAEAVGALADVQARSRAAEAGLGDARARIRELEAVLDTATDGVAVVDGAGRILSLNRAAEALFGYDSREVVGEAVTVLLAPESHMAALQYLDRLRSPGAARLLNDGREVMGRVRQGGTIPLFMAMGPVSDGPEARVCAVLRDVTAFKKAEGELIAAKRVAEEANAQKSNLLAKISHEIRTPLNAIIGFAEVMLEERFGPVGNERYKDYLKDVHLSGTHVISLVNDLLDLAKIEAGRMDLAVRGLSLNELISASVALLQPQAARERIVLRTSFGPNLPSVMADERSVRQIALNLLSNAIKFTDPGGQVIVSTAATDRGEVAFRVRDTGIGMSEAEIAAALEPFRQLATARRRGGTGLGLPLTKALVEANRGALVIRSAPNEGTLVEVLLPTVRVAAG
jgi:PAS domain S-box-containing protein